MKMNLSQTRLVGLTMELDLKAREYKTLCAKLDELKKKNIDPNDERLLAVKDLFQRNHDEIVEINKEIKEIKKTEELKEKQQLKQYNPDNIFDKKEKALEIKKEEALVTETKKNIFTRFIEKIKSLFQK